MGTGAGREETLGMWEEWGDKVVSLLLRGCYSVWERVQCLRSSRCLLSSMAGKVCLSNHEITHKNRCTKGMSMFSIIRSCS